MRLNPHLTFNGDCEAAFRLYEKCLGGTAMIMRYEGTPLARTVPSDWQKKILHATLTVGNYLLQGVDVLPGQYEKPRGFSVMLNIPSPEEAERIFNALSDNGSVEMPLQETFWALRFGTLIDQFGIPWTINSGKSA